jgi:hypothetical protein
MCLKVVLEVVLDMVIYIKKLINSIHFMVNDATYFFYCKNKSLY